MLEIFVDQIEVKISVFESRAFHFKMEASLRSTNLSKSRLNTRESFGKLILASQAPKRNSAIEIQRKGLQLLK